MYRYYINDVLLLIPIIIFPLLLSFSVETEVSVSEMKENENKCLGSSFIKTVLATQL